MKLKRNKLFLLIGSLGVITSSCLVITSCSKNDNPFDGYDYNTVITLTSKKQANQLYEIAITKLPQWEKQNSSGIETWIYSQLKNNSDQSKTFLYWEIALNISVLGKSHDYKKNGNLIFDVTNGWFTITQPDVLSWCTIQNVTFNYGDTQKLDITTSETVTVNYESGSKHWFIYNDSTPLFQSWILFNQPSSSV